MLNKIDLLASDQRGERLDALEEALSSRCDTVLRASGATGEGAATLVQQLWHAIEAARAEASA